MVQYFPMLPSWKGRGWLIGATAAACLLAADFFTTIRYHDSRYYASHGWPKLAGFWTAAAIVYTLLPRGEEVLAGTRDVRGTRAVLRDQDLLFRIKGKYWPVLLLVLGVVFYFVRD